MSSDTQSSAVKKTALLKGYGLATRAAAPALPLWLRRRAAKGKEDPARLPERYGLASQPRPDGLLVWMHAASVGESQMLLPVIARLKMQRPDIFVLITTGTVTSAALLEDSLPKRAMHQYAPADHPKAVRNFLDHWRPSLAIFAESELWPNMILETKARDIPLALINARMSAASIERWAKRGKKSGKVLLGSFDLILAGDTSTADGLSWLTGREVESAGNLKNAAPALPADPARLSALKAAIGRRPVWCAASTHKGEEEIVADAALALAAKKPSALLILAPRHPERTKDVAAILKTYGLSHVLLSKSENLSRESQVLLVDSMGQMGLAYRLAQAAFVGGSLLPGLSGHNPLEPARLNCAVLTGSHIASFADTYMAMLAFNGVKRVLEPEDLTPAVTKIMTTPKLRKEMAAQALAFAQGRDAVLDYVWNALTPLLPEEA